MATDAEWAHAYATQALSDLEARELLAGADRCHRLHFLQMATEKVCKAYLVHSNGMESVRKSHGYIVTVLPQIARNAAGLSGTRRAFKDWQMRAMERMAREIQVLAPACDESKSRPDNSEYPWLDPNGRVQVPCRYSFAGIDENDRILNDVISLLRAAAQRYVLTEQET